ncbi:hypothetical protein L9F63_006096, partial [Diploptera punctata]
ISEIVTRRSSSIRSRTAQMLSAVMLVHCRLWVASPNCAWSLLKISEGLVMFSRNFKIHYSIFVLLDVDFFPNIWRFFSQPEEGADIGI